MFIWHNDINLTIVDSNNNNCIDCYFSMNYFDNIIRLFCIDGDPSHFKMHLTCMLIDNLNNFYNYRD